jgi:hypothetical protein
MSVEVGQVAMGGSAVGLAGEQSMGSIVDGLDPARVGPGDVIEASIAGSYVSPAASPAAELVLRVYAGATLLAESGAVGLPPAEVDGPGTFSLDVTVVVGPGGELLADGKMSVIGPNSAAVASVPLVSEGPQSASLGNLNLRGEVGDGDGTVFVNVTRAIVRTANN